ncbi:GIY-YIG nuclease family protein [Vibrio parahaemolyticus]|nr:GIY-YIG nuclease family protein [Vibrio parahaemolyticus]
MKKLYLMRNENDVFKIGISDDVMRRLKEVEAKTKAKTWIVFASDFDKNAHAVEQYLHEEYKSHNVGGEYFKGLDETLTVSRMKRLLATYGSHEVTKSRKETSRMYNQVFKDVPLVHADDELRPINDIMSELRRDATESSADSLAHAKLVQGVSRGQSMQVNALSNDELIDSIKTLPNEERRIINITTSMRRKEQAKLILAKRLSGKGVRELLLEVCDRYIEQNNINL